MAFTARNVLDRIVQYPKRFKLKDINTGAVVATYDLEADEGIITEPGTAINKAYLQPIEDELARKDLTLLTTLAISSAGTVNLSSYPYDYFIFRFRGSITAKRATGSENAGSVMVQILDFEGSNAQTLFNFNNLYQVAYSLTNMDVRILIGQNVVYMQKTDDGSNIRSYTPLGADARYPIRQPFSVKTILQYAEIVSSSLYLDIYGGNYDL